jgi:hypothetical protein
MSMKENQVVPGTLADVVLTFNLPEDGDWRREWTLPEEARRAITSAPSEGYRWFISPNVIDLGAYTIATRAAASQLGPTFNFGGASGAAMEAVINVPANAADTSVCQPNPLHRIKRLVLLKVCIFASTSNRPRSVGPHPPVGRARPIEWFQDFLQHGVSACRYRRLPAASS